MVRIVEAEHLFPHRIELACTVSPYLVKLREIVYALAVLEYRHLEAAQRIVRHELALPCVVRVEYLDRLAVLDRLLAEDNKVASALPVSLE